MSCHTGGDKWHAAEQGDEADEGSIVAIVSNMPRKRGRYVLPKCGNKNSHQKFWRSCGHLK
jgi:hypothetical protein